MILVWWLDGHASARARAYFCMSDLAIENSQKLTMFTLLLLHVFFSKDGSTLDSFESLSVEELNSSIESRRNDIFRLMEEVRRLRVQQKVRTAAPDGSDLLSFR